MINKRWRIENITKKKKREGEMKGLQRRKWWWRWKRKTRSEC